VEKFKEPLRKREKEKWTNKYNIVNIRRGKQGTGEQMWTEESRTIRKSKLLKSS
jgi:hypothetical protein